MRASAVLLVGLVFASLAISAMAAKGFQLKVEPKTEDCFYRDFNQGAKIEFEWRVLDGGLLDVDVRVRFAAFSRAPPASKCPLYLRYVAFSFNIGRKPGTCFLAS